MFLTMLKCIDVEPAYQHTLNLSYCHNVKCVIIATNLYTSQMMLVATAFNLTMAEFIDIHRGGKAMLYE